MIFSVVKRADIRPLAGSVILRMEGYFDGEDPIILIPGVARGQIHQVGAVVVANMTDDDRKELGVGLEPGMRVLMPNFTGRVIDDERQVYRCCDVLAIIDPSAALGAKSQDVERCRYCGAARTGTHQRLLLVDGICPRCHKNERGNYQDPDAFDVPTDEEFTDFVDREGIFEKNRPRK